MIHNYPLKKGIIWRTFSGRDFINAYNSVLLSACKYHVSMWSSKLAKSAMGVAPPVVRWGLPLGSAIDGSKFCNGTYQYEPGAIPYQMYHLMVNIISSYKYQS